MGVELVVEDAQTVMLGARECRGAVIVLRRRIQMEAMEEMLSEERYEVLMAKSELCRERTHERLALVAGSSSCSANQL